MGVSPFVHDEIASPALTTAVLPEGLLAQKLREFVAEKHGIMIAGANVPGGERAFRIGHMGPEAMPENAVSVLVAIEDFLCREGLPAKVGQCLSEIDP